MSMPPPRRKFQKAYVEITSACNLSCSFCPPLQRPQAWMTVDRFQRVVVQLAPVATRLFLHVKGEPLLHPHLDDLLDLAHRAHLGVELVTNGTLLPRWADELLNHPALRRVHISLQSLETWIGADQALAFVHSFVAQAEDQGLRTELRSWKGTAPREGTLLGPRSSFLTDAEFRWPRLADPVVSVTGFCLGLRDQLAVLVDGTVVPCCLDGDGVLALGNLFEQDLPAILNRPRARAHYQGFSEGRCVEPLCQRCQFRRRFDRKDGADRAKTC